MTTERETLQQLASERAVRSGADWSEFEHWYCLYGTGSDYGKALNMGRTVPAVCSRRSIAGRKVKEDTFDSEKALDYSDPNSEINLLLKEVTFLRNHRENFVETNSRENIHPTVRELILLYSMRQDGFSPFAIEKVSGRQMAEIAVLLLRVKPTTKEGEEGFIIDGRFWGQTRLTKEELKAFFVGIKYGKEFGQPPAEKENERKDVDVTPRTIPATTNIPKPGPMKNPEKKKEFTLQGDFLKEAEEILQKAKDLQESLAFFDNSSSVTVKIIVSTS